jgi:hypothetical protein
MQVEKHWRTKRHGDAWSESDNRRLRVQIRRIWGFSERARAHTTQTPFPSLLTSTTWTETETWYTCDVKWSIQVSARVYTSTSQDKALAEELCDLQAVFWDPNSTWNWKSTSGSNRAGRMVQVVSHHEENGDVLLNVRSLHHSDHHKYGDIRITSLHGGPSIRSIIQQHDAREIEGGLRISLSVSEIGDPTTYPWVGKPPHTIANPRDQSPNPLIPPLDETLSTRGTVSKPKRTRKMAGSTTSKDRHWKDESMVIEASRWAVLQTETTPDSVITHWITSWKQLAEWERLGGHTLHWAVSTACQQHYQLDVLMSVYSLTTDPSFKSFIPDGQETPRDSRALLQL